MKRKVLGMVLATSMVAATLVGCGGGDAAPAATEPAAETEAPAAEAEAEAEAPAADAEAEAPAADAAAPSGNKVGVAMPSYNLVEAAYPCFRHFKGTIQYGTYFGRKLRFQQPFRKGNDQPDYFCHSGSGAADTGCKREFYLLCG